MVTAVNASISTPVRSVLLAVAKIPMPSDSIFNSISTLFKTIGWQSGINSLVFLAPIIPAIRAVANTSPLGVWPFAIALSTSVFIVTLPDALATRTLTSLPEVSTMLASPFSLIWLRLIKAILANALTWADWCRSQNRQRVPNFEASHFLKTLPF